MADRTPSDAVPILPRVRAVLRRWLAVDHPTGIVVAVSGGGDSVGLLRALHVLAPELNLRLSVAHLNHGVRGEAAEADAQFVEGLAALLGLRFNLGHWAPSRPGHFESDARHARYSWLDTVARSRGASMVAVGHTRDDQAETILHRILRGTGLRGLSGMPTRRPISESVTLIRPLLSVTRREIRDYLATLGQDFREDATNADLSRARSRIRHELLPWLASEVNPRVDEALVRLGHLASEQQRSLEQRLDVLERKAMIAERPDRIVLDRVALLRLLPRHRVELLRRLWRRQGWPEGRMGAEQWKRLARQVEGTSGQYTVGSGVVLTKGRVEVRLARFPSAPDMPPGPLPLAVPGEVSWRGGRVVATLDETDLCDETIDLDRLELPLQVVPPAPGDCFDPLGMGGRHRPVKDLLRERGVPPEDRPCVPMVCDARGIVWVVGHRIAERVRLTDATTRRLGLRWTPPEA